MSDETALGPGREFDAIRSLVARWGKLAKGIGDDAAVVDVPRGDRIVTSVDAFVEGVHFRPEWIDAREAGYRATTAALSDLAAMGATPIGVLFAVALPESRRVSLDEIGAGVGEAVEAAGTVIIGGNITAAAEFSITTTVIGHVFTPSLRSGAMAGDRLYVTGHLGGPGAALAAWLDGRQPLPDHRARFARPTARIREARMLAERGAHACIDISDGLASELAHLAAASRTSFSVELERVPCLPGVSPQEAVRSGEEYELLIAAPELDVAQVGAALGCPITEIGRIDPAGAGLTLAGKTVVAGGGHSHLS